MELDEKKKAIIENAYIDLENERKKTHENMSKDISKISNILYKIKDLSPEGQAIRDDLLGLLEFESDSLHQIDSLMIDRRKQESKENIFKFQTIQRIQ